MTKSSQSHSFDVQIAIEVGVDAAIVLNHLNFWIGHNRINGLAQHDGKTWMYQSTKKMSQYIPYYSKRKIEIILDKLVSHGYVIKGCFNKNKMNRTNWYTVSDSQPSKIIGIDSDHDDPDSLDDNTKIPCHENGKSVKSVKFIPRKCDIHTTVSRCASLLYKDKKEDKDIANTIFSKTVMPASPSLSLRNLSFNFSSSKFENITDEDLSNWRLLYPSIDIQREILAMQEWCLSNPYKAKARKHWRKFITTWLSKANNEAVNRQVYAKRQFGAVTEDFDKCKQFIKNVSSAFRSESCELQDDGLSVIFIPTIGQSLPKAIKYSQPGFIDVATDNLRKYGFKPI